MADYASDEEQLEALKRWWHDNGRSVIAGLVIVVGLVGGWRGWTWYTDAQAEAAAGVYHEVLAELPDGRSEVALEGAQTLREDYSRTHYATLGALAAARIMVHDGDPEGAAEWLQWVVDHAREDGLRAIARTRLARVLGETGEIERALALLSGDAPTGWAAVYDEIEGDLLASRGDYQAAAEAYQRALDGDERPVEPGLLELKLDRVRAGEGSVDVAPVDS